MNRISVHDVPAGSFPTTTADGMLAPVPMGAVAKLTGRDLMLARMRNAGRNFAGEDEAAAAKLTGRDLMIHRMKHGGGR